MQVTKHIHALRIPFKIPVSPGKMVDRVVYAYLIFGEKITLVDSGVSGSDSVIFDYIKKQGRDPREVSMLILTHSHPDHLGGAKAVKRATGCKIAAHRGEKQWIEDTAKQFRERPVPGFHTLVEGPVMVDRVLEDCDRLEPGEDLRCKVMHTPGHSSGSISLFLEAEKTLISADLFLLPDDLPIYENIADCVASIRRLLKIENAETLLSSWEPPIQGQEKIRERIKESILYMTRIHAAVLEAGSAGETEIMELCRLVVDKLGLPAFAVNPLVARAFASSLSVEKNKILFD